MKAPLRSTDVFYVYYVQEVTTACYWPIFSKPRAISMIHSFKFILNALSDLPQNFGS